MTLGSTRISYLTRLWHPTTGCSAKCGYCWARGLVRNRLAGPGAQPLDLAWVREVRDQCAGAPGCSFAFKHDSGFRPTHQPKLDGRQHRDLPWVEARR